MVPKSMADFPPNLEDGESWLPSDVFLEIISTTNAGKNNKRDLLAQDHPAIKSPAIVAPEIQLRVKPNVKSPAGTRAPGVNHGRHPCRNHGNEAVSRPFNAYNSKMITTPAHNQTEGFTSRHSMFVHGKSEGTGFFLPRFNKPFSKESGGVLLPRGTGVFLNHQVMDKYKYGDENNVEGYEKKNSRKDRSEEDEKYEPQFTCGHQICLPREWTYSAP
ncbi:hypothetical protein OIU74_019225 [Salix koriyanagi]|uniref:Uncharacterized protein n=1 Tax=Salix koriyanagi TaxID=2511006 RepID=A0A9Q0WUN2_9ROSI|nr:hypothetical protein OIU74_019225 [Salix koriyanagi]